MLVLLLLRPAADFVLISNVIVVDVTVVGLLKLLWWLFLSKFFTELNELINRLLLLLSDVV